MCVNNLPGVALDSGEARIRTLDFRSIRLSNRLFDIFAQFGLKIRQSLRS